MLPEDALVEHLGLDLLGACPPPLGALVIAANRFFDALGAYSRLFIGSAAVGLGGMAMALAFPPLPRERLQPA